MSKVIDLLKGTVGEVTAELPKLSVAELVEAGEAESKGENRSTLLAAIGEAVKDRALALEQAASKRNARADRAATKEEPAKPQPWLDDDYTGPLTADQAEQRRLAGCSARRLHETKPTKAPETK